MTIDELRKEIAPLAKQVGEWARFATADEFAPWVAGALFDAEDLLVTLDNGVRDDAA